MKLAIIASIITISVILFDQITKILTLQHINVGQRVEFIPGILSLTRHYNPGAAWGMFGEHTAGLAVFSLISSFIFIGIIYWHIKDNKKIEVIALAVALGGTIGNMIDRFIAASGGRPGVVDMLRFEFVEFPIFNVADIAIVCGMILFGIMIVFFDKPKDKDLNNTRNAFSELEGQVHDSSCE